MDLPRKVAKMRYNYHLAMIDINNVMNHLHLINDEKADEKAKLHAMTIFNDILPRLGKDVKKYSKKTES